MKLLFAVLVLTSAKLASPARASSVPDIAEIYGVRVGRDSMEALEHAIGRGLPQTGGHPHGARLWQSRGACCLISADGFYYTDRADRRQGRIIDSISITRLKDDDPSIPLALLPRQQTRFLGVAALGMTKPEVLHVLKSKLPPPSETEKGLVWEAKGFFRVNRINKVVNNLWRAELRFADNKLQEIRIETE